MKSARASLARLLGLLLIAALALQLYFLGRVALFAWVDPRSTTVQRSELWHLLRQPRALHWSHHWVSYAGVSRHLKRAVIASEDAGFAEHAGVDWDALEKAWERNQRNEANAVRANARADRHTARPSGEGAAAPTRRATPKLVGGSTITQQLAKNLVLSGERNLVRKGEEIVITGFLEMMLSKERILEIYLNEVEWGEGVFGAEAAARRYFHFGAGNLSIAQAAGLAVLLPAPKRFEKRPASPYLLSRASTIMARMSAIELP